MRISLTTEDQLILRDGRPFGDAGSFGGNSLNWPQPQTIAGMVRTMIGFNRDENYFQDGSNIEKIKDLKISKIMPYLDNKDNKKWLVPLPADLICIGNEQELIPHQLSWGNAPEGAGTDINNPDWLYPFLDSKEKPSKIQPFMIHWDIFDKYIRNKKIDAAKLTSLGIKDLPVEERIHNGIDDATYGTVEGKLFMNHGIYLKNIDKEDEKTKISDIAISLEIDGLESNDSIDNFAYLGGERKVVNISKKVDPYPECPNIFTEQNFLRLILITPGDFGSWCPDWLMPNLETDSISWVQIPQTEYKIRLKSASLSGWEGVSGWDYQKHKPKATKKVVKAGAVYLIELQDPTQSQKIAEALWGSHLNNKNLETTQDGYGQILIGLATIQK